MPAEAGIYLICVEPSVSGLDWVLARELRTVLYAGKSNNLRQRFKQHTGNPNARLAPYVKTFFPGVQFQFAVVADADRRTAAEFALDRAFGPPCAAVAPPSTSALRGTVGAPEPIGRAYL